jgi:hypothetical protein
VRISGDHKVKLKIFTADCYCLDDPLSLHFSGKGRGTERHRMERGKNGRKALPRRFGQVDEDKKFSIFFKSQKNGIGHESATLPCRRGAVDIAPASGTRRPGFESRQGIRFLGKHSSAVVFKKT